VRRITSWIEELIERRLVPVGVDEGKEIHHVVQRRDNIINGFLFSHHKEFSGLLGLVLVRFTMEVLAVGKLLTGDPLLEMEVGGEDNQETKDGDFVLDSLTMESLRTANSVTTFAKGTSSCSLVHLEAIAANLPSLRCCSTWKWKLSAIFIPRMRLLVSLMTASKAGLMEPGTTTVMSGQPSLGARRLPMSCQEMVELLMRSSLL
jgi:hypothetical protein